MWSQTTSVIEELKCLTCIGAQIADTLRRSPQAEKAAGKAKPPMRSGGFPCRFGGCDECFTVSDQTSMPALLAASTLRTQHEVTVHGYTHVQLEENRRSPYAPAQTKRPTPVR